MPDLKRLSNGYRLKTDSRFNDKKQKQMRTIKNIVFILILFASVTACRKVNNEFVDPGKTVLVYMIADNSLSGNVEANIDSLMAGVARNTVKGTLLIYLDNAGSAPQLMHLVKGKNGIVTKQIIKTYLQQNSVSPTIMSSVFADMSIHFPSLSYGLVLWSHGYGWIPGAGNLKTAPTTRWFGQDGSNYMDIPDLATALSAGPHFSYILFDACFMSGVETAYALRKYTDYLIASPTEVLADGFPYGDIIPSLFGSSESDYIKTASTFYDHYNIMDGYNRSASVACIKCSEMENLATETNKLISIHITELNTFSATNVQYMESYSPHLFYDFGHFVEGFTTAEERSSFEQQLNKTLVYKACTPNIVSVRSSGYYEFIPVGHYSGLNTYIPQIANKARNTAYHLMEWYTACGWNKTSW